MVGGDLNAALRFDALYPPTSVYYGNAEWFGKAAAVGWRALHPKFHAGEQRTLFRPGKDEAFQLDHRDIPQSAAVQHKSVKPPFQASSRPLSPVAAPESRPRFRRASSVQSGVWLITCTAPVDLSRLADMSRDSPR